MNWKFHIIGVGYRAQVVRLACTFVFLLLFAKLVQENVIFRKFDDRHARVVHNIFTQKELALLNAIDQLEPFAQVSSADSAFIHFHGRHAHRLKEQGLYLFMYLNDTLRYWSTKEVAVPETYSSSEFCRPYVSLGNNSHASGKYASFVRKGDGYEIVGLVLIKNVYNYENKFLQTSFHSDFNLPANVKIFHEPTEEPYHAIIDSEGQFVWALIFDKTNFYNYQVYLPTIIYLAAIFIIFLLLNSVFAKLHTPLLKNLYLAILAFILVGARLAMQHWQIPAVFYQLDLFKPLYFGSSWFPSLGELCLWCLFIFFFVVEIYRFFTFYQRGWKYFTCVSLSLFVVIVAFFTFSFILKELVINSSGIFERGSAIMQFNWLGFLIFTIILKFLMAFFLLLDKTVRLCRQELTFLQFVIVYTIVLSTAIIGNIIFVSAQISLISIIFLSILVLLTAYFRIKVTKKLKYPHFVFTVFVIALFTSIYINRYSNIKYENKKIILVNTIASQRDLTAEFLLIEVSSRIISELDVLADYIYSDYPAYPNVLNYIRREYFFSSFWNRYNFRYWVCDSYYQFSVGGRMENCIDYFRNMTETMGTKLFRSEFWFIERPNEISRYLGWFRVSKPGEEPLQLFIELWSGTDPNELGYPELLLDARLTANNSLRGFSYARYRDNKRIFQSGDFRYSLTGDMFHAEVGVYTTFYFDGMEHMVYRPDENNMVVLSSYSPTFLDHVLSFSYIFIFFLIVISLYLLFIYLPEIIDNFQWNFRNKIQYSLIFIMLITFILISIFTVYYVNRHNLNKNSDIVSDKMRAIHSELQNILSLHDNIADMNEYDKAILTEWLEYFQMLFSTDINLYDVHGQLIVTSLPDIFDMGLIGRQINPDAYIQLALGRRTSIIEHEEVGGLQYLSAYEIFVDADNKIIAYLNLPYFTHHDDIREEISTIIAVLLTFYMLIILLTVLVSVIMSNQITQPLMMLQEKFKNIKLGAKNEPINYRSHDELGGLVNEYNRAIEELAKSANRLARHEREVAWREMAKQIAHEINNPLTPMKLSIQHLKRAYDNKSERFDDYMEKISRSLVEQIDNLSEIATEFSNFAKMPVGQNERIDLLERINNVIPIFAVDDNRRAFRTDFNGLEHAMIYADKEQISRVFINLFKNSLQAIPKDRQADIHVEVLKLNRLIWVRIKDNGIGIPEAMQEKIFSPSFTSKSSGMGLGLSIVLNIIENIGGTINFKTRQNEGTTFIISLPAAE